MKCWKWTKKDDVAGSAEGDAICYIKDFWSAIWQLDATVDEQIRASARYDQMRLADKNDLDAFLKSKSAERMEMYELQRTAAGYSTVMTAE